MTAEIVAWSQPQLDGTPTARNGHSLTALPGRIVLFGGIIRGKGSCNDIHVLFTDSGPSGWRWEKSPEGKGEVPPERSSHSATAINDKEVLVFGGQVCKTTLQLFNDIYILNLDKWEWRKPLTTGASPAPRGRHTANLYNGKLYVFGGYGQANTVFGDLFCYDIETSTWTRPKTKGAAPSKPRFAHSAALSGNRLFLFAGTGEHNAPLNDCSIINLDTMEWEAADQISSPQQLCKHAAIGVKSAQAYKLFLFGGQTRPQYYSNDVDYFDTETNVWKRIEAKGKPPCGRADSSLVYEPKSGYLVLFGGWANEFLGDLHALDVSSIVGPPYALSSIDPIGGPVMSATHVTLKGMNFFESTSVKVMFCDASGKNVVANGQFVNDSTVTCDTPPFDVFGPADIFVRVSIINDQYTVPFNRVPYKLFLDTKSSVCLAYGPGVLASGATAMPTSFIIWAKDRNGKQRKSGGDKFDVSVTYVAADGAEGADAKIVESTIEDMNDGSYVVAYTPPEQGIYTVSVLFDKQHIRGSPWSVEMKDSLQKTQPQPASGTKYNFFAVMKARIVKEVAEMEVSVNNFQKMLALEIPSGDLETLLKVMAAIDDIKRERDAYDLKLAVMTETAGWLRVNGDVAAPRHEKKLVEMVKSWQTSKKDVQSVEKALKPHKEQSRQRVQKDLLAFVAKVQHFRQKFGERPFVNFSTGCLRAYADLNLCNGDTVAMEQEAARQKTLADLFDGDISDALQIIKDLRFDLGSFKLTWDIAMYVEKQFHFWQKTLWADIDTPDMEDQIKRIPKELRGLHKNVRTSNLFVELSGQVRNFQNSLPLVANLAHPAMRPRHWKLLMEATKTSFEMGDDFALQHLLDLNLPQFEAEVEEIVDRSQKEEKMENTLQKIQKTWADIQFVFAQHKQTDINMVNIGEEDFATLEDQQVMVQNMIASKYLATYEDQVMYWRKSLANVADVMQLFQEIQRTWAYLEVLFIGSEEVQRELPEDCERFRGIDVVVKQVLKDCGRVKVVVTLCNEEGLLKKLEALQKDLNICQKALDNYLEGKRAAFPRFYFVSTADLLDILSNGNQPRKIMKHIPKIFQAIKTLQLEDKDVDGRPIATGLDACVGIEQVTFHQKLPLVGRVEEYLHTVIKTMQVSLARVLRDGIKDYEVHKPRHLWLNDYPSQCMLVTTQVYFTSQVVETFALMEAGDKDALKKYNKKQIDQLVKLITLVQGELSKPVRQKVMVLITLDTHARDVVGNMIRDGVSSAKSFAWESQLRQVWMEDQLICQIQIADARFNYGFEYLGNGARLVITPLTDRIYITASQSLHLKLGCAPAGPAGTGKTETVKDLSSQVGKPVYVFNCSDQMDYQSMGNIFKGLAASGSWGCFDEFNRLVPEVLSVCSVQFKTVIDAIRGHHSKFTLLGSTLSLDETCGVFITMNPGYLGRSELPESLKALFRPITVVVPDLELICENMLMAEGFIEAKSLARKFVTLYALCRDLLSKQDHYDWGLRAIKTVLVVAGGFKRAEPDIPENDILMRALRDSNLAKIPAADVPVFMGLIGDLFPGITLGRKVDDRLEEGIKAVCAEHNLVPDDQFRLKIAQLDELLVIRHCIFVIGTSGNGKSAVWSTLARTWTKLGRPTTIRDIDPKAISANELYGYIQMSTREWKDGLLSNQMRELGEIDNTDPKWIILDGDLDTNWIESMNSVMDDNKILTLASNERIPLLSHMRLIFEIRDLRFATPATVSRAGIIFVSDGRQWYSYAMSWITTMVHLKPETRALLKELFEKYCPLALEFILKQTKLIVNTMGFNMVQTLCNILTGILTVKNLPEEKPENEKPIDPFLLEQFFVFAAVWGFGGGLAEKDGIDYPKKFSDWWKEEFKLIKFPARGDVFDVYLDPETRVFIPWRDRVPKVEFNGDVPMQSVTVPTPETTSISYFMDVLMNLGKPVMLVGNAGCGKTALVQGKLRQLNEDMQFTTVNLNYYTDSLALQNTLEVPLEKKAGRNYGPPGAKRMVYFVDDLNMPMLDAYHTQQPLALMRQHIDYGHWYDRTKLSHQFIRVIQNTQYVAAMNPTAGSFVVNPRLQRHFATFAVDFPSQVSLMDIYRTFLTGHLASFTPLVQELKTKIIEATLMLHSKVVETFRKTAINFHYEFNIRHLANVFQGILMSEPAQFKDEDGCAKFVSLWLHECERVYCDRLVNFGDVASYKKVAKLVNAKYFQQYNLDGFFREKDPPLLVFCHFAGGVGDKIYNQCPSLEKLRHVLEDALNEYNEDHAQMNLLLFEDALKHVCRISRIIENPSGHALLVGVGGSGKQSLSRLAAHVAGYSVNQITISSSYGLSDLKEDLKQMYIKAGVKDEGIAFLFTDSQITDERFLVYINDLLASGDIPDLFATEDKDNIINGIRAEVKGAGLQDTRETCWEYFLNKVRRNLHVILCFSPVGDAFAIRPRRFPALINCTVIDWFHPWPEDALLSVARRFLADTDLGDEAARDGITRFMPFAFKAVNEVSARYLEIERRYNYTTPKSFLGVVDLYKSMLSKRRQVLTRAIDRLQTGVEKLTKTAKDVAVLEEALKVKSVEVEEKKEAADAFAEKVGLEKAKVEAESSRANVEAAKCEKIAADVAAQQAECARQLASAEPLVKEAERALDTVTKKDLGETKALKQPPAGVDDVTAAILVLLSPKGQLAKDRSWKAACSMMGVVDKFLATLRGLKPEIDAGNVPAVNFQEVRKYLVLPHFNHTAMYSKSRACAGLCVYVINIVKYYDVVLSIEPLRQALAKAETDLNEASTKLAEVKALVAELEEKLRLLVAEYDAAMAEKEAALAEAMKYQRKLDLAQRLVKAVGSESERWGANVNNLGLDLDVVTGDVLLAASFVSYIGGFSKAFRLDLLDKCWIPFLKEHNVPLSASTDVLKILTDEAQIASWMGEQLPSDRLSLENGVIVANCERWPLLVDPQLQGIKWIKEKEAKNDLQVLRLGQHRMLQKLESAIETGKSVLIENMGEKIDAVLNPVIARQTIKKLGVLYVQLGDHQVEYSKNFKLFLHTKLSNPHYPPETQAETTLINFTVTEEGLEDQLLAVVVSKERPDLEAMKSKLITEQNEFKVKLKDLEDQLLRQLAEAQGDLTENVQLIENLEDMKRISDDIKIKMQVAAVTEVKINKAREIYRSVSARGALLFFLLMSMRKVNVFYQYSLVAFKVVFLRGIDRLKREEIVPEPAETPRSVSTEKAADAAAEGKSTTTLAEEEEETVDPKLLERISGLVDSITYCVYQYTRRGLFEKHKLIFASQLAFKILTKSGKLDDAELAYLIQGKRAGAPPPMGERLGQFIPDSSWAAVQSLIELTAFTNLADDLLRFAPSWEKWCSEEKPEFVELPFQGHGQYKWNTLSRFQKLLILRALRPDRLTSALSDFVEQTLGKQFVEQEPFDLHEIFQEASAGTPLFFILFPGARPVRDVEDLGRRLEHTERDGNLLTLSMGQGQEKVAEGAIEKFGKEGGWVFLDNVHLMQSWLPRFETFLEAAWEQDQPGFRCFYSAEYDADPTRRTVPESIIQTSIKIVNEPQQSLRANLKRALQNFDDEYMARSSKPKKFRPILFALCFFHALVLGRRKFGSQGWSRFYSFNTGDLQISADVLFNYLETTPQVPWEDLRYLFGEIMYGGHITDVWDRRTCSTYLTELLTPKIFEGGELAPGFKAPEDGPGQAHFLQVIDDKLPREGPTMFGLHPNAEIGFLTTEGDTLFKTVLDLDGAGGSGSKASKRDQIVMDVLTNLMEKMPATFNLLDIQERMVDKTPYLVVMGQECDRMNLLLAEMTRSLMELKMGLEGSLNISEAMEALANAIFVDRVPSTWTVLAYPSLKSLGAWFTNLLLRVEQLQRWSSAMTTPACVWVSGMFNPMAYFTAVMQVTARQGGYPLDNMCLETNIITTPLVEIRDWPDDGAYVSGMFLEGARWSEEDSVLADQQLKQLHPALPVMHVTAVLIEEKISDGIYNCPVYITSMRGPTNFVFTASMRTTDSPNKWVLRGVALLLSDD
eukprot:TRINITY_DN3147_c0_g1_i1.p1 TRINITY_DN3147_c0_g1~~TRINITY_DN3147_c0_g1_i1.p1  ORF type:complete len:4003 (-),score=857.71 TRINITY_DN3147_c0_g1_i1:159-12167(-)